MDFWSRLIGGSSKKPSIKRNASLNLNVPQQRLLAFKQTYNELLQLWQNGSPSSTPITAENLRIRLSRLSDFLSDDLRGPTPHPCISFAATSRLLVTISKIASYFLSDGIIQEAMGICNLLIDCEEEGFLEDTSFADALTNLVGNVVGKGQLVGDVETESLMVEVLFTIASRARGDPRVLEVWFRPGDDRDLGEDGILLGGRGTGEEDFPLFHLLLHFVAAEGRAGEFGRMGVLFMIESAGKSKDLEKWVIESDTATFMASSLGALYSQLSRKLVLSYNDGEVPPILAYSERVQARSSSDGEQTTSPSYQGHLSTFLAYLMFWQDILEHCTSTEVKQTLLDHFKYLFLQQLLYPSLLESSDVDGGSSVAVLTYLRQMLEMVNHPDLVGAILGYLLGKPMEAPKLEPTTRPTTIAVRRKSQLLIDHHIQKQDASPDLFTLVDLITSGLQSKNQQTISATFRLCSVLLRKQHLYTGSSIIKTRSLDVKDVQKRSLVIHKLHVDGLLDLAEALGDTSELEISYDQHLYDVRNLIEQHPCSKPLLELPDLTCLDNDTFAIAKTEKAPRHFQIDSGDQVLAFSVASLEHFFFNDIETNLACTQVIADLALCGLVQLEPWLITTSERALQGLGRPNELKALKSAFPTTSSDSTDEIVGILPTTPTQASSPSETLSPIFRAIDTLVRDVESYGREIHDFAALLAERRQSLETWDMSIPTEGPKGTPTKKFESKSDDLTTPTNSPPRPTRNAPPMGSISDRLHSEKLSPKLSPSISRSSSPRGRLPPQMSPAPSLVGRLTHLQSSSSKSPSRSPSRAYSPSPLRKPIVKPSSSLISQPPLSQSVSLSMPMQRRITLRNGSLTSSMDDTPVGSLSSDASSVRSLSIDSGSKGKVVKEVSLGHLLTNVIILQEFILELAAIIEVRAGLFDEVGFS